MSRINTNIPALMAQDNLANAQSALSTSLRRLSSGLRVNTAADDPAGLIISELLRGEMGSISSAISNTQRATNIITTTEGALNEVNSLLVNIRSKVTEAASKGALSQQEIDANQLQIDSAVQSITRIANSTEFGGRVLLNGNLDYVYSSIPATAVSNATVYAAQFGSNAKIPVNINIKNVATAGKLTYAGGSFTATQTATIEVAGNKGSQVLSFVGSTHTSAIVFAVNAVKDVTGVSAAMSGAAMRMDSMSVGSAQFVSVNLLAGKFATNAARAAGTDANATVDGTAVTAVGNTLNVNTVNLQAQIILKPTATAASSTFYVTGGGALFQIGPSLTVTGQYNIGVQSINPGRLGSASVGYLNQVVTGGTYALGAGGANTAAAIIDQAISQVATLRGRMGALQTNTMQTNTNSLNVALENITSAESTIRDTDFAAETSNMTRDQILVSAGTSVLQLANSMPQSVLALLGK